MKKGLGKGLDAYFGGAESDERAVSETPGVLEIDINKIEPNRSQPRDNFDERSLNELADSIREFGLIQPIIVRNEDGYYSIVAGERRWRAARIARLSTIPCIVRDYDELATLEAALIENIQRADLNPIEEARTYKRLSDEYGLTQEEISKKVGKSRSAVANAQRLLALDSRVQTFLTEGRISAGHARAILALESGGEQFEAAERVIEDGLNARDTEALIKELIEIKTDIPPEDKPPKKPDERSVLYKSIERDLNSIFGTRVNIRNGKNKGRIEIEFFNDDDLDRLLMMMRTIENRY
ncbi:MAG: ParB/RepB/Spo0J family partition protein [Clostridiales bacterium]|jgi:ParB family chromosome partitioning protein|nr:ParB/RepB/Spo0J family partition protein [Clostridiales bacterium]